MIPKTKRLYCIKCHTWTEHSVAFLAECVTCLSCGKERKTNLGEIAEKPPEMVTLRSGGPEKRT